MLFEKINLFKILFILFPMFIHCTEYNQESNNTIFKIYDLNNLNSLKNLKKTQGMFCCNKCDYRSNTGYHFQKHYVIEHNIYLDNYSMEYITKD